MNYQELIQGVEPEILEQEPVYAGFRPTKLKYTTSEGVIIRHIEYANPADSAGWAAIKDEHYEP